MKALVGACTCAISLGHLDFRLFMFGSSSQNQDEFTVSFISRRKSTFNFLRNLFEFGAYVILLIYGLQSSCTGRILYYNFHFSKQIFFFPSVKAVVRTDTCAISLVHLDFRCLAHIRSWTQDEFTYFFFETEVHLPILQRSCSNLVLMQFSWSLGFQSLCTGSILEYNFISGSKFLSHPWSQLLELALVLFL